MNARPTGAPVSTEGSRSTPELRGRVMRARARPSKSPRAACSHTHAPQTRQRPSDPRAEEARCAVARR
eukprot:13959233-Alexandrium_andersonii.AAC.1